MLLLSLKLVCKMSTNKSVIYCLVLICFTCIACKASKDKEESAITVDLDIKLDSMPKVAEVRCIPLETNEESMFSNITKLIYRNNLFYIFDREGKSVLVFDSVGTFIRKIHAVGSGPDEYIEPSDMDVDSEGNIYIADNPRHHILKFTNSGNKPIDIIPIEKYFWEFAVTDSNYIYLSDVVSDRKMNIKLAKYDCQNQKMEILENSELDIQGKLPRFSKHYFYRSDNKLFYYKRFMPYIFNLSKRDTSEKDLKLISEYYPTKEKINEWETGGIPAMMSDYNCIHDISACYETDNSIFIVSQTMPSLYTVIDKHSNRVYNFNSFKDKRLQNCIHVLSSNYRSFVSVCPPTSETIGYIETKNLSDSITLKRLAGLSEEFNPVLVLFRFGI